MRQPFRTLLLGLTIAAVLAAGTDAQASVGSFHGRSENSPQSTSDLVNPTKPYNGVYVEEISTMLTPYAKLTMANPNLVLLFKNWVDQSRFNRFQLDQVHSMGATPIIAWEPWNPRSNMTRQPPFTLKKISSGYYDTLIKSWADGIRDLGYPVMLRMAHEMNGHWYPWCVGVNGNKAQDYVRAWRHVHNIFTQEGANNVAWVWAVNVNRYLKRVALKPIYPGDSYVDLVGMDGFGTQPRETFSSVFGSTIAEVRKFTKKPFLIAETGAQELHTKKAAWISSFFRALTTNRKIVGFIWFNANKRAPWIVNSSRASIRAFRSGLRNYLAKWRP
jgi:mannan endo-1,4-beta-mannosidase